MSVSLALKLRPFSKSVAALFLEKIAAGQTVRELTAPGNVHGFPSFITINHWLKESEEFALLYKEAKAARSEHHRERALTLAEESLGLAKYSSDFSLAISTHLTLAKADDPDAFAQKNKTESSVKTDVEVRLFTGILRPGDAGYDEYEKRYEQMLKQIGIKLPDVPAPKQIPTNTQTIETTTVQSTPDFMPSLMNEGDHT